MIGNNAGAAPSFKLKAPKDYFSDDKTLALLKAALAGDLATARHWVAQGANPNDEGPRDNLYNRLRLLHYAIAANSAQAVKVLIAVGADPELNTQGFGPAMLFALGLDNTEMLSLLLALRPINNLSRETLDDLLFESVTLGRPRCLEVLLTRGAPIDLPDDAGYTIFMHALDAEDYDLAEWILLKGAAVVREPTISGAMPTNILQFHLNKYKSDSPSFIQLTQIKQLMEARGATFPVPTPAEIRAQRGQK